MDLNTCIGGVACLPPAPIISEPTTTEPTTSGSEPTTTPPVSPPPTARPATGRGVVGRQGPNLLLESDPEGTVLVNGVDVLDATCIIIGHAALVRTSQSRRLLRPW